MSQTALYGVRGEYGAGGSAGSGVPKELELIAAAFILYGALVVGGGKKTQEKVSRIYPDCEHALFDVREDDDMLKARKAFRQLFSFRNNPTFLTF